MMKKSNPVIIAAIFYHIVLTPKVVHAYIGPGMSIGGLLIAVGLIIGIILFLIALIWFPIKRKLFNLSSKKAKE